MIKQNNVWFMVGMLLVLILFTSSCSSSSNNEGNNEVEATEKMIENTSTPAPTKTKAVSPTKTIKPTLDEAATATELALDVEDTEDSLTREWSVPAYPDSVFILDDRLEDPDALTIVQRDTRIFAIAEPYFYEFYQLPDGLRFADVKEYFLTEVPKMGYKGGVELQGYNQEIYVLSFVDDSQSLQRKVLIEYWRNGDLLLLIYKNPE